MSVLKTCLSYRGVLLMVDCINSGSIIISGNWKIQIMGLDETRVPPKYLQPSVVQWTSRERCVC